MSCRNKYKNTVLREKNDRKKSSHKCKTYAYQEGYASAAKEEGFKV